ncbi:type II secretion system F family protein [Candidatus Manganitrophus noduliformans]|uniref:Type II secretion system F family protein n=1 Tax=Candidatus Manganitrophus noduliformans TaxID=2606439 RepID=A0A7X6DQY7_9BACT|nr:type II secretion system F family protein [Candidatus Manganitrophus noduliformans]NKE71569.1 type II secretion system F family protein [Candidatus Manganitrophus noduliformans]
MATFEWTGKTRQGTIQKGQLAANSREEVIALLRKENILVTSVQQKAKDLKIPGFGGGKVSDKDIVIFTRQFATMIDAGLPLVQCLEILSAQCENPVLAKAVGEVRGDVEGGSTYADALRKHPKVFDDLYVNMVAAGEAGGILDTILNRLAKHIEKSMKLKKQIKSAMVYPSTIMGVAGIVIVVLLVFVIPIFAQMFTDFGGTLPALTQFVIDISYFMKSNILIIVGAVGLAVFGFKKYYRTPSGRKTVDKIALKLPVLGDLIRKAAVAKFTRTLGTLIASGVPILEGLGIVAKTAGNKIIEQALMNARQSISEGKTISDPLGKEKVFPPMVVQMIAVGETTGALDAMLSKIADFYDDEVDSAVGALTSLLEPMLMVFLGITIGTIVIAMYLPIFKLASVVG